MQRPQVGDRTSVQRPCLRHALHCPCGLWKGLHPEVLGEAPPGTCARWGRLPSSPGLHLACSEDLGLDTLPVASSCRGSSCWLLATCAQQHLSPSPRPTTSTGRVGSCTGSPSPGAGEQQDGPDFRFPAETLTPG